MKTYRVAIVGLGRMGSTLDMSIANASRASQRLEVVAGADILPERRKAMDMSSMNIVSDIRSVSSLSLP